MCYSFGVQAFGVQAFGVRRIRTTITERLNA
jgi:hypothetical protein